MVVGIVSDTHGATDVINVLLQHEKARDVEAWLHAGDFADDARYIATITEKPVYHVEGNSDWPTSNQEIEKTIDLAGHRIFLAHGHTFGVRHTTKFLLQAAHAVGADIAVYGHTHVAEVSVGEMTVLNPGSLAKPRDAAEGSFIRMELEEGTPPRVELIRMEQRLDIRPL